MPFTFAHPAAILPLRRFKSLQTIPLIIGSVAPDLVYYVPSRWTQFRLALDTHTALGAVLLDIPIGLSVLMFCFLLRGPLTLLMSPRARALCLQSMESFKGQTRHWLWAIVAIYVGTWTHIAWDSFTHENGWITKRVAALSTPVSIGGYTGPMCHILQYASSAAGLLILAIWYARLPTPAAEPANASGAPPAARAPILLLLFMAATAIGMYVAGREMLLRHSNYHAIFLLLTRAIAWFVALYLAAGLFFFTLNRRKPEPLPET